MAGSKEILLLLTCWFCRCGGQGKIAGSSAFSGTWHLINPNAVVCPGSPGFFDINMSRPTDDLHSPHVFTVFRTTNDSVTLQFTVKDAAGKVVVDKSSPGITLKQVARRLQAAEWSREVVDETELEDDTEFVVDYDDEEDEEDEEDEVDEGKRELTNLSTERRLSARRRSGGGRSYSSSYSSRSYTSYSRSRTSYTSYSRSRTSSSSYSSSSYSSSSISARRRGYTQPTSPRRRYTGYNGNSYSNPSSPLAGRYGYTSQSYAYNNFGGRPPMSAPYGYYGANAYKGNSGMKIAMAAGGGLLAGYVGSQLLHNYWSSQQMQALQPLRNQLLNSQCTSGTWSGLCSTCITLYTAEKCSVNFSPNIDATRDDMMNTGFIPADYTWPLQVKITGVTGEDFQADKICPSTTTLAPLATPAPATAAKLLFLTITTVEQLAAKSEARQSESGSWWEYVAGVVLLCCCCGCCFAVWQFFAGGLFRGGRKSTYSSSSDSEYSSDDGRHAGHYPHPVPQPPLQPYGGGFIGANHPQPYAQSVYPAPVYPAPVYPQGGFPQGSIRNTSLDSSPSIRGTGSYFMSTAAPNGMPWRDYVAPAQVETALFDNSGLVGGPWGECIVWATVFEMQNPNWEDDPRYEGGPVAQVINAMMDQGPDHMRGEIERRCESLEETVRSAYDKGLPLPVINQVVARR